MLSYVGTRQYQLYQEVSTSGSDTFRCLLCFFDYNGDREVVMKAVKQNGDALLHASVELKGDGEVVMEAVKQNGDALEHASVELHTDKEVVMESE